MRLAILGFAREGRSLLKFFRNRGLTQTGRRLTRTNADEISILDKNRNTYVPSGYQSQLGKNYLHDLNRFDIVFRSPGVPYNLSAIQRAIKKGVIFSSATRLFFEQFRRPTRTRLPAPSAQADGGQAKRGLRRPIIIGVTGTKGKGTTSTLIYKILKASKFDAYLAGNIGKPALEILSHLSLPTGPLRRSSSEASRQARSSRRKSATTIVVLELSSFQLQDLKQSPEIAVVLDIFPDHMDAHKSMTEYTAAKGNICAHQNKNDTVFYFKNNTLSREIAHMSRGRKMAIAAPDNLSKNKFMAAAVTKYLGCPQKTIDRVLKNFRGIEHRLELVRILRTRGLTPTGYRFTPTIQGGAAKVYSNVLKNIGIDFYNDSASTNPQTSAAAVLSFAPPHNPLLRNSITQSLTILIAGGKDKNLDYAPLAQAIKKSGNVKLVVLFGENKEKIYKTLTTDNSRLRLTTTDGQAQLVIKKSTTLKSAVDLAYLSAKSLITNYHLPITILFSPGAASFDMFKDYADRGEKFKKIVLKLK